MKESVRIDHPVIILLAAGESRRLGRPKQLLVHDGEPLITRALHAAFGLDGLPVIVVLGAHADRMLHLLEDKGVHLVRNPEWAEGMASSVRCGVQEAARRFPETDGVIIIVCDQPGLAPQTLQGLIDLQRNTGLPVAAASYAGRLGTPAIFHRSIFPELLKLSGDRGARQLLQQLGPQVAVLSFEEGALDIDTEEDYQRWISGS
ncbi:MAG: nucleotidyltransferase family protein [Chitinophagaceae bacterium]|jgi:molybdenum cofactor cytidylyltransferase